MHKKRQKIMHSKLNFRPVQIITDHVIYNSPYKYGPAENGHKHRQNVDIFGLPKYPPLLVNVVCERSLRMFILFDSWKHQQWVKEAKHLCPSFILTHCTSVPFAASAT